MFVTRRSLARRTFLRGVGATMALPFLDSMVPAFGASPTAPTRMGFIYVPNGIIMEGWTPKTEGAAFEITRVLEPLAPYREQMLLLTGLAQLNGNALGDGAGDHARAGGTFLTGAHPKKTEGVDIRAGISADQVAANGLRDKTPLSSLELTLDEGVLVGNCDSGYSCSYTNTLCWRTETNPLPMEINPRTVFERLFGDGETTDPAARKLRASRDKSVLDSLSGSIQRLEAGLGARDRNKLGEYFDSIRDIERRIEQAEEQGAKTVGTVMERPLGVPDTFQEYARVMFDMQVIALQADLTRVITFMMDREGGVRSYREIDVPDGHHSLTHHMNDAEKIEKVAKINVLHTKTLAYYIDKLRSTKDGDGSLLDHSMIVYGSSLSDGNRHMHNNLPIAVFGGGNGTIKTGRHVKVAADTPLNNLWVSMIARLGVTGVEKFGDSTGNLDSVLAG